MGRRRAEVPAKLKRAGVQAPEFSKFNAWTESRRTDYQVKVALYDVPKMIEKEPGKCLGCLTCPFSFESGGIGRSPKSAADYWQN